MLFTELRFAIFFAVVFAGSWALRNNAARKLWLLAASWLFYACFDPRYLPLLLASTAANFAAGVAIARGAPPLGRRGWVAVCVAGNLGVLAAFKYLGFLAEAAARLAALAGAGVALPVVELALPIGISFFTFQSISYGIDVGRGTLAATRRPLDWSLFIALFPHLVAGPIVRASELLPQLARTPSFADVPVRRCLLLFLAGFVKKACLADRIAAAVDPVFAAPAEYTASSQWLAAALYHVQIYCDFSGYTDMAIAVAALLGYRLPQNFDFPYLATSVRDFWRRWHMTLTRWFRDYLYVALGGNRGSRLATARNLLAVFVLCGLWHGAAWHFAAWGVAHGVLLVLERGPFGRALARLPRVAACLYVNGAVMLAWVLFRAPDFERALAFGSGLFGLADAPADARTLAGGWALLLPGLLAAHLVAWRGASARVATALPDWLFALLFGALVALVLPWVATEHRPFIYFQF